MAAHSVKWLVLAAILSWLGAAVSFAQGAPELQEINRILKAGQTRQALERANAYLATRPKDPVARFIKGVAQSELGMVNEAIATFQGLTEDYPELPEPYNNLAVLYSTKGQFEKARVALELAIQTHPTYATAHENLGDIYAKLASQAYDKALQLDRGNTQVATKLSLVRELFSTQAKANTPPRTTLAAATGQAVSNAGQAGAQPGATTKAPSAPAPVASAAPAAASATASGGAASTPSAPAPASGAAALDPAPVLAAVNAWANHWSRQDVESYLAAYSKNFRPEDGSSRAVWAERRRERLTKPRSIKVAVYAPEVTFTSPTQATVTFRQSYQSDLLKTNSRKTLRLVNEGGQWLIVSERTG
ncbi:MAG: tetratricopeptide repeat protein [Casimicrobiaceae bacterium]|nr:tetratricopeptide repeat protein [Casimicrobiaceae bacterium]MDW8312723.1 tetratricopeptide repeat protein [Burkholderiales bacterium]